MKGHKKAPSPQVEHQKDSEKAPSPLVEHQKGSEKAPSPLVFRAFQSSLNNPFRRVWAFQATLNNPSEGLAWRRMICVPSTNPSEGCESFNQPLRGVLKIIDRVRR